MVVTKSEAVAILLSQWYAAFLLEQKPRKPNSCSHTYGHCSSFYYGYGFGYGYSSGQGYCHSYGYIVIVVVIILFQVIVIRKDYWYCDGYGYIVLV